jgi:hypothetical protein
MPHFPPVSNLETDLVAACGSQNQQDRHRDGLLPEDELLTMARVLFFEPLNLTKRWNSGHDKRDMERRFVHQGAALGCTAEHLGYEVAEMTEAGADEYMRLKMIEGIAGRIKAHPWVTDCQVTTAAHWLTCSKCDAESVRLSAKVTITWAGRALVREYAL